MSQKPLWVGLKPLWVCVWVDQSLFYYFVMTIILLFSKTLIPPKVHYKLAILSSFLLILLLSLLVLAWFLVCGEQECLAGILLEFLACLWMEKASVTQVFGFLF